MQLFGHNSIAFPLTVLSLALGWSTVRAGGVDPADWRFTVLAVSLLAIGFSLSGLRARSPAAWIRWPLLLLTLYTAVQLVPLPKAILQVLSPARASLTDGTFAALIGTNTVPFSVVPSATLAHFLRLSTYVLVFLLIREIASRYPKTPWLLTFPIVLLALLEAVLGMAQSYGGGPDTEAHGTWVNRNHFAGFLEMSLPFAVMYPVALLRSKAHRRNSPVRSSVGACLVIAVAAVILVAIICSLSRMGFVVAIVSLFVCGSGGLLTRTSGSLRGAGTALALIAILLLAVTAFVLLPTDQLIARYGQTVSDGISTQDRLQLWKETRNLIADYPVFGSGLGTYESAFMKYKVSAPDVTDTHAHNDYLQLLAEFGTIGALIVGVLSLAIISHAVRTAASHASPSGRALATACLASFAAIALHSTVDFNLYIPANAMLLSWISAIAVSVHFSSKAAPMPLPSRVQTISGTNPAPVKASAYRLTRYYPAALGTVLLVLLLAGLLQGASNDSLSIAAYRQLWAGDTTAAVRSFRELVRRDAASPNRWCDLGDALREAGRTEDARRCFVRAVELGTNIPGTLLRTANFYFLIEEPRSGLPLTSRVLKLTSLYDEVIFQAYERFGIAFEDVLNAGLAGDSRVGRAFFRTLLSRNSTGEMQRMWAWLRQRGFGDERLADEYASTLLKARDYDTAATVWATYAAEGESDYLQSNYVYDGGFERELANETFGWRVTQLDHARADRDSEVSSSGRWSLRIQFDGKANLAYSHVRQTVFVRPDAYRFEARIRTSDITSDEGVGFRLVDAEDSRRLDVKTDRCLGTKDWATVQKSLRVPRGTRLLEVQVIRQPSLEFDQEISGTAWIDSVKLAPAVNPNTAFSVTAHIRRKTLSRTAQSRTLASTGMSTQPSPGR